MSLTKAKRIVFSIFLLSIATLSYSQSSHTVLNRDILSKYDAFLNQKEVEFHTSVKPYLSSELKQYSYIDSINNSWLSETKSLFVKKLRNEHLISLSRAKLDISLDPLFSVQPGFNFTSGNRFSETSAGASLNAAINNKFFINASISGGNSGFIEYIDTFIYQNKVVPGQGYAFKDGSFYKYFNNSGYLSYSASKYFNFQLGYDKNFIGDGYRSLLLSDNAYNYPFLKVTTSVWKLKYVNLFTNFKDIRFSNGNSSKYYNKYGTFHYLSWNVTKRINIGFFESIIFETRDTTGKFNYDVNYLNPVIFFRPVEYAIGSANNALMGFTLKIKVAKKHQLYGQLLLDEFLLKEIKADINKYLNPGDSTIVSGWWANKYGFQAGFKSFDLFKIKNLHFQTEYNFVRPYTYSHGSIYQNYGHFNQALAHPYGANFFEWVSFLRYFYKNFSFEAKFLYSQYGEDESPVYFGHDIYTSYNERASDYGNFTRQGVKTILIYKDLKVSYLVNPKNNMVVETGISIRDFRNYYTNQPASFFYFGFRTALSNFYYDR